MTDDRIIVTGCSGFVGRNTVKMLLEQGHHVIGLSRTNPNIDGLEYIKFDITDASNFKTTEYHEATIINTAALTTNNTHGTFEETNYLAVTRLLGLNPKGKFIQISSSSIYDLSKASEHVLEEEFQLGNYAFYNPYAKYKAKAEDALLSGIVEREVHPISLRPHAIYGEDDTTLIPELKAKVKGKTLILPNAGKVEHSLTNIKNLLQAIQLGMDCTPSRPEAFNITDAAPVVIADAVKAVLGESIKVKGVPTSLLLGWAGRILNVSQYEVRQLGFKRTYDLSKAKILLGYNPSPFNIDWV